MMRSEHASKTARGEISAFQICKQAISDDDSSRRLPHGGGFGVRVPGECTQGEPVFHFHRADGGFIKDDVPRVAIDAYAQTSFKQRNVRPGLVIDAATAQPDSDGEPMDRDMAIDCMFSVSGELHVRRTVFRGSV